MLVNATNHWLAIFLVACGAPPRAPEIVNATPPAVGCPAASDVRLVSYSGDEKHGWFLPLGTRMMESPENPLALSMERAMTDEEASAFAPPTRRAWLVQPDRAPCEVTYGKPYVQLVADGEWNQSFRIDLRDCAVPTDGKEATAILVFAERAPTDCKLVRSHPVTAYVFQDWKAGGVRPPLPAELRALVPMPGAKQVVLYRVSSIDVRGTPAFWAIDTSRVTIGKPDDECNWDAKNLGMLYERNVSGSRIVPFSAKHTSRTMEVFQYLYGALVDNIGLRSVIVTNLGEYQVFDLTQMPRTIGYHLRWYMPNTEDYASDGVLGPYCGP